MNTVLSLYPEIKILYLARVPLISLHFVARVQKSQWLEADVNIMKRMMTRCYVSLDGRT